MLFCSIKISGWFWTVNYTSGCNYMLITISTRRVSPLLQLRLLVLLRRRDFSLMLLRGIVLILNFEWVQRLRNINKSLLHCIYTLLGIWLSSRCPLESWGRSLTQWNGVILNRMKTEWMCSLGFSSLCWWHTTPT